MESCVEIGLVSTISVVTVERDRFNHFQDGLATLLAFIAIICLSLTPFYLLYVNRQLSKRKDMYEDATIKSFEAIF